MNGVPVVRVENLVKRFGNHNETHAKLIADRFTFLSLGEVIGAGTKDDLEGEEIRRLMAGGAELSDLELFPIRWNHLIDKKMRRNKEIERAFRSHTIGIRSSRGTGGLNGQRCMLLPTENCIPSSFQARSSTTAETK